MIYIIYLIIIPKNRDDISYISLIKFLQNINFIETQNLNLLNLFNDNCLIICTYLATTYTLMKFISQV